MNSKTKLKILFLCTGNSCRSQMAEGFARHLKHKDIEAYSAGIAPKGIDPMALKAMAEVGIDISAQKSKNIDEMRKQHIEFDYVITLCDNAQKTCPSFPVRTTVVHVGFDDPPRLAAGIKDEEKAMAHYRKIRDEIRAFVEQLPERLVSDHKGDDSDRQGISQTDIKALLEALPPEIRKR